VDVKERVRTARNFLKLSQEALAMETGSQRTTVAGYESGISLPRAEFLRELSIKYGINPNWILTGQGDMLNEIIKKPPIIEELQKIIDQTVEPIEARVSQLEAFLKDADLAKQPAAKAESEVLSDDEGSLYTFDPAPAYGVDDEEEYEYIPYVHDIAAGPPIDIDEDRSETVAAPARLLRKGGQYYAATVRGGSMAEAGIRDGDLVLIRHTDAPRDGAVQVVRYRDKSTLKLLRETEGGGWELHYRDGTGRVIKCDSGGYETQGEFEAILPGGAPPPKTRKRP